MLDIYPESSTDDIQVIGVPGRSFTDRTSSSGNLQVDVVEINSTSAAAVRLGLSAGQIIPGTVDTGSFTATTTQFEADNITEATTSHFNGRIVIFTSGALAGQATDITAYSLSGSNGKFSVTALTEAPANDITFVIV